MARRTTIEIDETLLARAQAALGASTIRGTVEEALRRATAEVEGDRSSRRERQRRFLSQLPTWIDLDELGSERMWR